MHSGVMLMCAVTNDLLDMERLRAGTLMVKKAAVAVRSAVDVCIQQVQPRRSDGVCVCVCHAGSAAHTKVRPASAVPLSVEFAPGVPSEVCASVCGCV
jgi:hypothetical protein